MSLESVLVDGYGSNDGLPLAENVFHQRKTVCTYRNEFLPIPVYIERLPALAEDVSVIFHAAYSEAFAVDVGINAFIDAACAGFLYSCEESIPRKITAVIPTPLRFLLIFGDIVECPLIGVARLTGECFENFNAFI